MDEWSKYLYLLIQNITFGGWVITLRADRTLWSVVPVTVWERVVKLWSDSDQRPISTHRTRPVIKNPLWNLTDGDRTRVPKVRSLHCSTSGLVPDYDQRPVSTHRTRPFIKNHLWNLTDVDRTLAPRVRSLHCSASGQYQTTVVDQMNWPDSPSSVRSQSDQHPVSHLTLHSLPTWNPMWMKLTPIDLRAISELLSARFDKCAPHLTH